jgi:hypothetical protein
MFMVCYFTVLLHVEVRQEEESAYDRGRLLVFRIRQVSTPVGLPCSHPPDKHGIMGSIPGARHHFLQRPDIRVGGGS